MGDVAFLPIAESAYRDVNAYGERPVGNGPYMLEAWNHDQNIELKPNPKYTGPRKARNGGINFVLYTDTQTAYADVESGNLDVIDTIPASALASYQQDSNLQTFNKPGPISNRSPFRRSSRISKVRRAACAAPRSAMPSTERASSTR